MKRVGLHISSGGRKEGKKEVSKERRKEIKLER